MNIEHTVWNQVYIPLNKLTPDQLLEYRSTPPSPPTPTATLTAPENVFYTTKGKKKTFLKKHISYNQSFSTGTSAFGEKTHTFFWTNAWLHHHRENFFCSNTFKHQKKKKRKDVSLSSNVLRISPYSDIIAYICCPSVYLRVSVTAACWPVDCLWDGSRDADRS